MTLALRRRIGRLEHPPHRRECSDLARDIEKSRKRWQADPEGAARDSERQHRAFIVECENALAKGRQLSPLTTRMLAAYRPMEAAR